LHLTGESLVVWGFTSWKTLRVALKRVYLLNLTTNRKSNSADAESIFGDIMIWREFTPVLRDDVDIGE
jgi:hypothetical protein